MHSAQLEPLNQVAHVMLMQPLRLAASQEALKRLSQLSTTFVRKVVSGPVVIVHKLTVSQGDVTP